MDIDVKGLCSKRCVLRQTVHREFGHATSEQLVCMNRGHIQNISIQVCLGSPHYPAVNLLHQFM